MELRTILEQIFPVDPRAAAACQARWDLVAKPLGSLGKLEELLCCIAAITGSAEIELGKKCVLVFCADNGVLAQGVAQCGHKVTTNIACSLAKGSASVNAMAHICGADVLAVDMGMVDGVPELLNCRLSAGTGDISVMPAMTREMAQEAILTGIRLVGQKKEEGYRLLATGEAGIGNTTSSSAMASVLLNLPVERVTGRGSGLSDEGMKRKQAAIRKALLVNQPDPSDPLDVLSKVGGFDIAAMTGVFLGGGYYHVPIVMDGLISSVAALCAVRLCPQVRDYILPSHITAEPAGQLILQELGFSPILDAGMRLGEGSGAVALFPLLDMAAAVYHSAATFDDLQMEAYKR